MGQLMMSTSVTGRGCRSGIKPRNSDERGIRTKPVNYAHALSESQILLSYEKDCIFLLWGLVGRHSFYRAKRQITGLVNLTPAVA